MQERGCEIVNKYKHIVVFGYPRSGTTLLYCMLSVAVEDYQFYDREFRARAASMQFPGVDKITKRPTDVRMADWIVRHVPDVGFILCVRDPRSILVSKLNGDPEYEMYWDRCTHSNQPANEGLIKIHEWVMGTLKYSPFICRYEDLVMYPLGMQKMLRNYFEFEYKNRFDRFHEFTIPVKLRRRLNGARPVEMGKIESWKQNLEKIYDQFTQCEELFEIVKYWGYEKDDKWFDTIKHQFS